VSRPRLVLAALATLASACFHKPETREYRTNEQASCSAAAAQVGYGTDSFQLYATLGWCDESGPAAIAGRWAASLPSDTLVLRAFLFASGNLRDRRVFDAAFRAAIDSIRPRNERGAALLVLAAQFDPRAAIAVRRGTDGSWVAELGTYSHSLQISGGERLQSDARQRVDALATSILEGQPPTLRHLSEPLYGAAAEARLTLHPVP